MNFLKCKFNRWNINIQDKSNRYRAAPKYLREKMRAGIQGLSGHPYIRAQDIDL